MKRLCSIHGMIEAVNDGTCAVCDGPTLDPLAASDRADIARARSERRKSSVLEAISFVIAIMFALGPFVASAFTHNADVIGFVPVAIVLAFAVSLVIEMSRELDPVPAARLRFWTSATVLSVITCFAFVGVKHVVGVDRLAFSGDSLTKPWLVITSTFTHTGLVPLGINLLALLLFGPVIDLRLGRARTTLVLAASAFAGAYAHALCVAGPVVGFSAAIYGLFGATFVLLPRRPRTMGLFGARIAVPTWTWLLVFVPVFALFAQLDHTHAVPWVAQVVGLIAGGLVALPMRKLPEPADFVANESVRAMRMGGGNVELSSALDEATADAGSTPAEREFHLANVRRQVVATGVGGLLMMMFGLAAAALATALQAPALGEGRRINTIAAGLIMIMIGIAMMRRAVQIARRR